MTSLAEEFANSVRYDGAENGAEWYRTYAACVIADSLEALAGYLKPFRPLLPLVAQEAKKELRNGRR